MASKIHLLSRQQSARSEPSALDRVSIRTAEDIQRAARYLDSEVRRRSMRIMAWHDLGTMSPIIDLCGNEINSTFFGWKKSDVASIEDIKNALRSPIFRACRVESEAFWVQRNIIGSRWQNKAFEELALEDLAPGAPFAAAIIIPVHLPFGQIGAAILTSSDEGRVDISEQFVRDVDNLSALVRRFIGGYSRCLDYHDQRINHKVVTARQVECLRWAALGKTDWEIAVIVGFSHAAVRYHLTKACENLSASNRSQAIFRACQLGYLGAVR